MVASRLYKILLASSTLGVTLLGSPALGLAGPEDGTVTAGNATITQSGLNTSIHQSSDRAIIDWRSFDVNANESVRFYQPGSSSITLNRINDSKASFIDGSVTANGQILILNQNGVVFGANSRVDVAGLVASTGRVNDAAFMSGATTLNFTAGDNQSARIINNGHITARDAGLVGLVAPNVENNGVITAHLGKVTLAGAERFTLDLAGDGLISIDVDDAFNGSVKNTGTIVADGGTIVMTATRARDAVEQSIINTGTLQANSVGVKNGRIILSAGGNRPNAPTRTVNATAAIKQAGKIEAKSGAVEVLGDSIHLTETSVIDVSGQAGDGGTINIGGSFQGEPDRPTATWVEVDRGSTTKSNGDIDGNGGTIIFWADRLMTFRGTVEAEGGDESGDGGFVEVSGKNILVYDGYVSTLAAHGKTGTLLLDPTDIVISSGANQAVSGSSPYTPNADNATSVLNVSTLQTALTTSSVTVQTRATGTQQGNITVSSAITWTSANTLTLDAHNQIIINQAISGRNLTLTADGDIQINAALTGIGTLTIMPKSAGGTIGIGTETGTLQLSAADLANITDGWANIIIGRTNGTGAFRVGAATWNDNLTLRSTSGQMTISGTQTMGANNLTISTDSNLDLQANLSGSGILTIMGQSTTSSVSTGTGNSGNLNLDNNEITRISDGWSSIVIGSATAQGYLNIGGGTWNDNLTLITYSGNIVVNGVLRMASGNNLNITTTYAPIGIYNAIIMNGADTLTFTSSADIVLTSSSTLTGSGNLVFKNTLADANMTLGAGASGGIQLSDSELNRITDGWAKQTYQTSGNGSITVNAYTWKDNVELINGSGVINISGAVNMGNNNLTITTNGNPNFASTLAGSGILTIQGNSNTTIMNIAGSANNLSINTTELGNILTGWTSVVFGKNSSTAGMNIGTYIWQYDTTFKTGSGVITVGGPQISNANSMTYETDGDIAINANIYGSGTLTIRGSSDATTMSIAGAGGTLQISATEVARLQNGWSQIVFGRNTATGTLIANANTWTDSIQFITGSGLMTIGAQTMNTGTHLTLTTDSDLVLSGTMVGTGGKLTIEGASAATAIGVGTGQTGNIVLDATDISRLGTSWSGIQIGKATSTGAINLGANSWTQRMTFITSGNITLNGAQTSNLTSGTSLVFASLGGNFVNATGSATPITAGTGSARYLIYSLSAATDTYGTMTAPGAINAKTYFSYGPGAVVETGNRIIYSTGAAKVIYIQIDDKSKVYGDATPTMSWTYLGGLQGSDTLGSAITNSSLTASGSLITDDAGTTRSITGTFTTGLGYTVNYTSGTLIVIKAPVTVQAAATSREYGDANPSTFAMNYLGLRNGDTSSMIDVNAVGATTATATSGVNTYAITTSGGSDNNYVFNYTNGVLTVTKATITVTADDKTREYGDSNPALTLSYSGFKNSETTSVFTSQATAATAATTLDHVGSYIIEASGAAAANYNFNYVDGSLAITKANLTITAADKTRVYGDNNPALTVGYSGFKNSDTIASLTTQATASTAATSLDNVGNYAITASGAASDNYSFTYVDGSLAITKALLTITADNKNRIYGDNNPALTVSYNGFKNSDTATSLTTQASAATSATALNNVGNYTITASGAASNNYSFAYVDGSLAITKALLTITADNKTRIYGDNNPALTVSYNGFKNSDTATSLITQASAATSATNLDNVGSYAITASGAASNNYSFAYVDGSLGITKAVLTVTADDKTRIYGDNNPALTVSYNGFKNSDTATSLTTQASAATSATALSNVGDYTIAASGAASNNYSFNYVDGSLGITKALLTITADNKTRIYGDSNPALTVSYNGFKNSDTASSLNTQASATTSATTLDNVGSYAITASGAASNNYSFAYVDGSLAITKALLTITADNKTRVYGDNNPALTVSYNGFKNTDTASSLTTQASAATSATILDNVGNYTITASGAASNNYSFAYVDGSLAITKATLTATADNKTRIYGDSNPLLTTTYSGFKNNEDESVINVRASASTTANAYSNAGNHVITTAGALDDNYTFAYVDGSLAITKAAVTVTVNDTTRQYGATDPTFSATYLGFKNGENESVLDTAVTFTPASTTGSNVGTYTITASGAADTNYSFTFINGNLLITQAALTIQANDQIRLYGEPNPPLTYSVNGLRNGDTTAVLSGLSINTPATTSSPTGTYAINIGGATALNYTLSYTNGSLQIVGTMPPPAPPVTTLPSTAQVTLSTPSITSTGSTGSYNMPQAYTFTNSPATLGHEAGSSSATTENGYIAVVYYQDPLQQSLGEPLLFIDPELYARQEKKETLADFIVH